MLNKIVIYWIVFCSTFVLATDFDSFVETTLNQVANDKTIDIDVFNKKNWRFRKETFSDQQAAKFWFVFLQKEDELTKPFLAQEVDRRGRKVQQITGIPAPSKISGQVYAISALMRFLKPQHVKPTKMGFDFPGAVSSSERFMAIRAKEAAFAKKISRKKDPKLDIFLKPQRYLSVKPRKRKLLINCSRSRWFTTGIYADPGELLQFKFPASMVNKGFRVRIGANKDDIRKREEWVRWPLITIEREIDQANFKIANPNGGIVYIIIPDSADPKMKVAVGLFGGSRMPHFYLGKMNPKLWSKIKNVKAPWAVMCKSTYFHVFTSFFLNFLRICFMNNTKSSRCYKRS